MKILFVLLLAFFWTSLSFPLLVAGSSKFSLEFFIYDRLQNPSLWPEALSLILFQTGFVFIFCFYAFFKKEEDLFDSSRAQVRLLSKPFFLTLPLLSVFLSLGGLFLISSVSFLSDLLSVKEILLKASLNTFIMSFLTGVFTLFFCLVMALSFSNTKARKFVVSFVPPGSSFLGFAFLLLPFYSETASILKWSLGLALLMFPWLWRLKGERTLESLEGEVMTAYLMGASPFLTFKEVIWRGSRKSFFFCAGLASFWACGDLAYSLIVSSGHFHLSLVIYDFFSSYKLDLAFLVSWILILVSFFMMMFWLCLSLFLEKGLTSLKRKGI